MRTQQVKTKEMSALDCLCEVIAKSFLTDKLAVAQINCTKDRNASYSSPTPYPQCRKKKFVATLLDSIFKRVQIYLFIYHILQTIQGPSRKGTASSKVEQDQRKPFDEKTKKSLPTMPITSRRERVWTPRVRLFREKPNATPHKWDWYYWHLIKKGSPWITIKSHFFFSYSAWCKY